MKIKFSDLQNTNFEKFNNSLVINISDNETEVWITPDYIANKLKIKIPLNQKGNGYPDEYEFTVNQFKDALLNAKKKKKKDNE